MSRYAGTRLGRQEIDGDIIEERADALWPRGLIERCRVERAPALRRIVVGIDPPGSARPGADACGIIAAGLSEDGVVYVLEDASVAGLAPAGWATGRSRSIAGSPPTPRRRGQSRRRHGARGATTGRRQRRGAQRARGRGKWLRAEPVAAMYAQGRVKHVGAGFAALEDEMADFGVDGLSSGRSPDRLDALVWAVTELAERAARPGPRIRGFDDPRLVPPWWRQFTR